MSVTYNGLHVDERYSAILEPNLYFNPILVPGVTCTDKYWPRRPNLRPPAQHQRRGGWHPRPGLH